MAAQTSKARAIQVGIAQASGTRHRTQERCTAGNADPLHPRLPPDRSIVRWTSANRLQRCGNRRSPHGGGRSRHVRPGGKAGSKNRASRSDPALQAGGATRVDTGAPPPHTPSPPRTRGVRIRGTVLRDGLRRWHAVCTADWRATTRQRSIHRVCSAVVRRLDRRASGGRGAGATRCWR